MILPSRTTRLPLAWCGKASWARRVMSERIGDAADNGPKDGLANGLKDEFHTIGSRWFDRVS